MKKLKIIFLFLCTCCLASAHQQVKLDLNIRGLDDKDSLTISWGANNKSTDPLIMQINAKDNQAIEIPLSEPRLIIVGVKGFQGGYELLLCPGESVEVSGRARTDDSGKKPEVFFGHIRVRGASCQEKYDDAIKAYHAHLDSIDKSLFDEYKDINKLMEKAKEHGDEQAIATMYKTQDGQSYVERVMSTYKERTDYLKTTVLTYKDSFMGPMMLLRLAGRLDKDYRPIYDQMSEEAKQSYYGREVKDEVYPPSLVGDAAPTLQLLNVKGEEKLISLAQHGHRYLLIDFWASWCSPCIKEIPNLKRLYSKYHEKGLDIVSISADHNAEDWKQALKEYDIFWTNYLDINRHGITEYKVQFIPSIFVVDEKGKLIGEKLRGKELEDMLEKLFQ